MVLSTVVPVSIATVGTGPVPDVTDIPEPAVMAVRSPPEPVEPYQTAALADIK